MERGNNDHRIAIVYPEFLFIQAVFSKWIVGNKVTFFDIFYLFDAADRSSPRPELLNDQTINLTEQGFLEYDGLEFTRTEKGLSFFMDVETLARSKNPPLWYDYVDCYKQALLSMGYRPVRQLKTINTVISEETYAHARAQYANYCLEQREKRRLEAESQKPRWGNLFKALWSALFKYQSPEE